MRSERLLWLWLQESELSKLQLEVSQLSMLRDHFEELKAEMAARVNGVLDRVRAVVRLVNGVVPRGRETMEKLDRMEDDELMNTEHEAVVALLADREAQIQSLLTLREKIANIELAHQQEMHGLRREMEAKQALINKMQAQMDSSQGALLDQVAGLEARIAALLEDKRVLTTALDRVRALPSHPPWPPACLRSPIGLRCLHLALDNRLAGQPVQHVCWAQLHSLFPTYSITVICRLCSDCMTSTTESRRCSKSRRNICSSTEPASTSWRPAKTSASSSSCRCVPAHAAVACGGLHAVACMRCPAAVPFTRSLSRTADDCREPQDLRAPAPLPAVYPAAPRQSREGGRTG